MTRGNPVTPQLLLDDAPGPALLELALTRTRTRLPVEVRTVPALRAETVQDHPSAMLLIASAEYAILQATHVVSAEFAISGTHRSAVVLVSDRPFDRVEAPRVEFEGGSRAAELLARATLWRYFGIQPALFVRDGVATVPSPPPEQVTATEPDEEPGAAPGTQVLRVLDGTAGLKALGDLPPDRAADLGRAWYIMTGLPPVSHLLLVPRALVEQLPGAYAATIESFTSGLASAHERRRELSRAFAERCVIPHEVARDFGADIRWKFDAEIHKSVVQLFNRGAWGMNLPLVRKLELLGPRLMAPPTRSD